MNDVKRVAIVGGVHGDELLGIYLVKKFQQFPQLVTRNSFEVMTFLANPQAIELNKRYVDLDLNRCFAPLDLQDTNLIKYEQVLAKKIVSYIKQSQIDFLIDIHSSTANMGVTLLLSNLLPFNLKLAAYLANLDPIVKVVYFPNNSENNRLRNVCQLGFTLEIGSIPHGVLDAIWFQKTEQLINHILDYLERVNGDYLIVPIKNFTLYTFSVPIKFPLDESGYLTAMVHDSLQGQDYCKLHPNQPMFLSFDGSQILYQGNQIAYPIFINESAYWENSLAMYLTTKQTITIKQ